MSYGHKVYIKSDAHINNVKYPTEVPTYALPKPQAIEDEIFAPIIIPDKQEISLTRVTIAQMIDFRDREIPIRLMKDDDILEITVTLNNYIGELVAYEDVPEAKEYLMKARKFYDQLQRSVSIISKRDPRALKVIRQNQLLDLFKPKL